MSIWLERKYIGLLGQKLPRFKKKSESLYNFRCILCGDSKNNATKSRGYIYQRGQAYFFKCHNCNMSQKFTTFMKGVDSNLYRDYLTESFKEEQLSKNPEYISPLEPEFKEPTNNFHVLRPLVQNFIIRAVYDTDSQKYLEQRMIPEEFWPKFSHVDDWKNLESTFTNYQNRLSPGPRIMLTFRASEKHIVGLSGRSLNGQEPRYQTIRIEEDEVMAFEPHLVDKTKPVYICEGAFDSLFLDNATAANGADLFKISNLYEKPVFVFDNQPRNAQLTRIMDKACAFGFDIVVWPQSFIFKDINEAIIGGMSREEINDIVKKNTYSDLKLKLALANWRKT